MRLRVWKWQNRNEWKFNQGVLPKHVDEHSVVEVQYYDGLIVKCDRYHLPTYWTIENNSGDIYKYRVIKY